MAKQTAVTARVLSTFRDKHIGKLRGKGTEFPCDEKRIAEINFGRAKPLVEIVGASATQEPPTEPEADATQAGAPTEPEAAATQAGAPTEPEAAAAKPDAAKETEPKGKGRGKANK